MKGGAVRLSALARNLIRIVREVGVSMDNVAVAFNDLRRGLLAAAICMALPGSVEEIQGRLRRNPFHVKVDRLDLGAMLTQMAWAGLVEWRDGEWRAKARRSTNEGVQDC